MFVLTSNNKTESHELVRENKTQGLAEPWSFSKEPPLPKIENVKYIAPFRHRCVNRVCHQAQRLVPLFGVIYAQRSCVKFHAETRSKNIPRTHDPMSDQTRLWFTVKEKLCRVFLSEDDWDRKRSHSSLLVSLHFRPWSRSWNKSEFWRQCQKFP